MFLASGSNHSSRKPIVLPIQNNNTKNTKRAFGQYLSLGSLLYISSFHYKHLNYIEKTLDIYVQFFIIDGEKILNMIESLYP